MSLINEPLNDGRMQRCVNRVVWYCCNGKVESDIGLLETPDVTYGIPVVVESRPDPRNVGISGQAGRIPDQARFKQYPRFLEMFYAFRRRQKISRATCH